MVTVAIPVLNGRRWLPEVLTAVRGQELDREVELLVCDSGSTDGSPALARVAGARVIEIEPGTFHHAETRNLLVEQSRGEFVAMLTQDATPASSAWLATLLAGFDGHEHVGLVFGPYRPRPDCPPLEAQRLERFFDSLSPDGRPRVDRLGADESGRPCEIGPARGYFTDANGCVRRAAWDQVRFPRVAYAEDHALAVAMLRAGWAKVYEPAAAVVHSHHYTSRQQMRRSFDDFRGLREVYGYRAPAGVGHLASQMRGAVGAGVRRGGMRHAIVNQSLSLLGGFLGSHADHVPTVLRRRLSLERRGEFAAMPWDDPSTGSQRCT